MRSIWAVAVNTIRQALRIRVAAVFIVLLVVLLPIMGIVMGGDGSAKGRLQTFVSYGLSLTSFLLCLLTIIASVYSVTNDFDHKQIYIVLTKPIRRSQLLSGKLLGIILLNLVLLVLFSSVIYGITIYIPKFLKVDEAGLVKLNNEFFTARASLIPADVDVTKEVKETYEKLERSGQIPPDILESKIKHKEYMEALVRRIKLGKRAAEPGRNLIWQFDNVRVLEPDKKLFIRFKYNVSVNPPDLNVYSRWVVGDDRQLKYGTEIQTPIYTFDRKDLISTFYEIEVPADAVAQDGYLAVGFLNLPTLNNTVVLFPPRGGLEVLYEADTFSANFLRAVFLVACRLIFLACLGILASSFLSFPVAILLCLVVFSTGSISGFIINSFETTLGETLSGIYAYTVIPFIMKALPQFDKFEPAKFLVPARLISWSLCAKAAGLMVCIKSVFLFILSLLIFRFREVAKVIV